MRILTYLLLTFCYIQSIAQVSIAYDTGKAPIVHAVNKLYKTFGLNGQLLIAYNLSQMSEPTDISVHLTGSYPSWLSRYISETDFDKIKPEGYRFLSTHDGKLLILAADEVGAMYGLLDLNEEVRVNQKYKVPPDRKIDPTLQYRIIKFNLPWSPYRKSVASELHLQVCRDLTYWERFLDMMAENRFNVLSLWNNHPFPYMIKATNFPKATPLSDSEMADWQLFWKSLFKMAKQRGIQTFIVNWNIVVSPEFAEAYQANEYNDLSDQVKRYTRESVTQVINEYPDLTGLGVTLADWMGNFDAVEMDPLKREDWIEETFVAGIREADRSVKFIHRSVLAGDPMAMRRVIDNAELADPALVEIKFNWSHGHSTPTLAITHDYHSGKLDDRFWNPKPDNYNIQWMIRNEDFFILRWGAPDFIRKHIMINQKDYVDGYFIGSEGYIPAMDYSHRPSPVKTWQYAFEKQWLFYKVWGRLLYQSNTPDDVFILDFDLRYGPGIGEPLLEAYELVSKMPLRLASFHRSTWDFTLYSEGFLAPEPSSPDGFFDRTSPLISIEELINHETLDPQMLSIPEYVAKLTSEREIGEELITPAMLADSSEIDSRSALVLLQSLRLKVNAYSGALISELDDAATWGHLGLYLADKIRAGIALESFRVTGDNLQKQKAITLLEKCITHWDQVIRYTKDRYLPTPLVSTQRYADQYKEFSWERLRPQVVRDVEIAKGAMSNK